MLVGRRDFDRHGALGAADIDEGLVVAPGKFRGDRLSRRAAHPGHRFHERAQRLRVLRKRLEKAAAGFRLVLRLAGAKALGQRAPETVEPGVAHLQKAADIARLGAIEKEIGFRRVGIASVLALQHAERHQGVEEIPGGALVNFQPRGQCVGIERALCKLGEKRRARPPTARSSRPKSRGRAA